MENSKYLKFCSLPLTSSTLVYSSTLRTNSRNKSKSRKTCETKNSSLTKPLKQNSSVHHRHTLKNDSFKAASQKKIINVKKRTQSESFKKQSSRKLISNKKDDIPIVKKHKSKIKHHCISGEDYSRIYCLNSPAQRTHIPKRSLFEETRYSKPEKY